MTYSEHYSPAYEFYSEQTDVSAHHVPALRRWLIITLIVAVTLVCRDLLWKLGMPVPLRIVSAVLCGTLVACLVRCCVVAGRAFPHVRPDYSFFGKLNLLIIWTLLLVAYGGVTGNAFVDVYKEGCGYLTCIFLMRLAVYDEVWQLLRLPLLVVCLAGAVVVVATVNMPGVQTTLEGTDTLKEVNYARHIASIGFAIRSIVSPGLLLGVWGLVAVRFDRWKVLFILALLVYAAVLGGVFEFRGVVVTIGGILVVFAMLSSVLGGRIPLGTIAAVILLVGGGLVAAVVTGKAADVLQRFSSEQIFDARIVEAQAFFDDMGPLELFAGRGMGANYNGPEWVPVPVQDGRRPWNANHFGILSFVLRGGFALLFFIVVITLPILRRRTPAWYTNELNLAATILMPFIILNVLINPVAFVPDGIFDFLPLAFCFARFAVPAPAAEQELALEPAQ